MEKILKKFSNVAEIVNDPVRIQNWIFWLQTQYFLHYTELPYRTRIVYQSISLQKCHFAGGL